MTSPTIPDFPHLEPSDRALVGKFWQRYEDVRIRQSSRPESDGANPKLSVEIREFRCIENWRRFLLLTPWALWRVLVGRDLPAFPSPLSSVDERTCDAVSGDVSEKGAGDLLRLGPTVTVSIGGRPETVHLQKDTELGRFLVQPLVASLQRYESAAAVFEAWASVDRRRNAARRDNPSPSHWQRPVSRRDAFAHLLTGRRRA